MKSMTGYGYSEANTEDFVISVEIKSYNNRFLDISTFLPHHLTSFQNDIENRIKSVASRGKVDVSVKLKLIRSNARISLDQVAVRQYGDAFRQIMDITGLEIHPSISDFTSVEGLLSSVEEDDAERFREPLMECVDRSLEQFMAARIREGESTKKDLLSQADRLMKGLEYFRSRADELEVYCRTNLQQRFDEMFNNDKYDENRILQEVAVMLMKYSINEEIVRLSVHMKEFFKLLELDEPVGKRLDFLCQEINREVNTIGSKSTMADLNLQVVEMKDSLENIREQSRNVE